MDEDSFHLGIKALVRDENGKILMLKLDPAVMGREVWDIPGGRVQRGHSVEGTLKREIEEETGLKEVTIGDHVGMVLSPIRLTVGGGDVGLVLSVYECTIPQGATIKPDDGHIAYDWVSPGVAAERLSGKYPVEFCDLINRL